MKYIRKPSNLRDIKHLRKSKNLIDNELIIVINDDMYIYDLITSCHRSYVYKEFITNTQASKDAQQTNISMIVQRVQSNQGQPINNQ